MRRIVRMLLRAALLFAAVCILLWGGVRLLREPSTGRTWVPPQRVMPRAEVHGDVAVLRNVRDFAWRTEEDFDQRWTGRRYDLRTLDSVWFGVSRFGGIPGLAHAFLSFGFGEEYVAISVEARKELGETYSPLRGLVHEYELMYVVGTERDVIGLRTNVWKEAVTLYPIRASREKMRRTFVDMVLRAEKLAVEPEFYDTVTSSCSSNIVRHVNTISPGQVPFGLATVLPGYSDRLAWKLGMIDSSLPFEQLQAAYRIDGIARQVPLDANFSRAIRRSLPRNDSTAP